MYNDNVIRFSNFIELWEVLWEKYNLIDIFYLLEFKLKWKKNFKNNIWFKEKNKVLDNVVFEKGFIVN